MQLLLARARRIRRVLRTKKLHRPCSFASWQRTLRPDSLRGITSRIKLGIRGLAFFVPHPPTRGPFSSTIENAYDIQSVTLPRSPPPPPDGERISSWKFDAASYRDTSHRRAVRGGGKKKYILYRVVPVSGSKPGRWFWREPRQNRISS